MNIVVYCSSRQNLDAKYEATAITVGRWIAQHGHTLVYGGVNAGMMHILAEEAHLHGAKIMGIVPQCFAHRADALCNSVELSENLNDRKAKMIENGDIFVVLPGGLGTIDEWISTLSQLIVLQDRNRKIVVANINHIFDHVIEQLEQTSVSQFARDSHIIEVSRIAHNNDELVSILNESEKEKINNYEKK